jgi:hypothetical protein
MSAVEIYPLTARPYDLAHPLHETPIGCVAARVLDDRDSRAAQPGGVVGRRDDQVRLQPLHHAKRLGDIGRRGDGKLQLAQDRFRLSLRCAAVPDDEDEGRGPGPVVRPSASTRCSAAILIAATF